MKRISHFVHGLLSIVVFSALVLFSLCCKSTPSEIRAGVVLPLMGKAAAYGEYSKKGMDLEVRPETGGLGHATPSKRGAAEALSPFHLADETWHEKQEESQL